MFYKYSPENSYHKAKSPNLENILFSLQEHHLAVSVSGTTLVLSSLYLRDTMWEVIIWTKQNDHTKKIAPFFFLLFGNGSLSSLSWNTICCATYSTCHRGAPNSGYHTGTTKKNFVFFKIHKTWILFSESIVKCVGRIQR